MHKNTPFVYLMLLITSALFASAPIALKIAVGTFDPLTVALFRFLIAGIIALPLFVIQHHKITRFDPLLIPISLLGTGNVIFFVFAMARTIPNAAGIIYATTPLMVLILSVLFLHENLTTQKIAGMVLGFLGTLLVLILPLVRSNTLLFGDAIGNLLLFIGALSWSGYIAGSRYLSAHRGYSSTYLMSISILTSTFVLIVLSLLLTDIRHSVQQLTPYTFGIFIYLGIGATVITYLLYQWVIKHSSAGLASLAGYIQPPIGFLLAFLILKNPLSIEFVIGTILAYIGVFIATYEQKKKDLITESLGGE